MKTFAKYFPELASSLFILLFVYAGIIKWIDYDKFIVQIGQSPILAYYAESIAWLVPLMEILIALLFLFSRTRLTAFFAGYAMMLLFTFYIFYILSFSATIPCSCGGILEKLGWKEHLVFNLFFIILAITAIFLYPSPQSQSKL